MNNNKSVIYWLLSGCILVFVMVVVGGITRLTGSGLSMTDWHLVTDTFPPMSNAAWQNAFDEYKKFPEYQRINSHFTIDDYKFIYFWEWFHRFIARILGFVFLIPFVYFLIKKKLDNATITKCLILLGMGAFQGFLGWFMVKSGLVDFNSPDVSHFRLSMHLTFAFITFAYTLWVALDLIYPNKTEVILPLRKLARITLAFLILQIIYGGFVAGLDAGFIHNHWPLMSDGQLVHESVILEKNSWLLRLTEGKSGVQLVHRTMAYIVVGLILFLFFKAKKYSLSSEQKNGLNSLVVLVFAQFALGVFTLLYSVPLWLGVAHQAMAFFLLAAMTYTLHRFSK
jgi:cytochrome c oxidase assembly protein subunit 15